MATSKLKFHTRYNPPPSPGIVFEEPTMTQQHFRDECDVNKIVERAIRTGDTTVFTSAQRAEFYDASAVTDYADAMALIDDVNDDFNSLPSATRALFGNNVKQYVEFMSNPRNWDKARELGLLSGGEVPATEPEVRESKPAPASPRERSDVDVNKASNAGSEPAKPADGS
ncbi:hypothetical protein [Escherichia coli]|uniref:hypothetical protein n=1 Tax=Escherichia coli TaxID=562 RepID=UPI0013000CC3|nr:hypothetical protein [Escherichia coli]